LKDRYDQARADEELLFLREEIALLDSRLADLLQRVDTGESGALWANLTKVWADLQRAEEGSTEYLQAWIKVDELMKAGTTDYLAWQELQAVIEQRRKLVESERKRVVELQQVITAERAMVLLSVVVDVVRRHVTDRNALAAISADIGKLVAREPGRTVGSEGR
jgi:predicted nucleic acid-binding protein